MSREVEGVQETPRSIRGADGSRHTPHPNSGAGGRDTPQSNRGGGGGENAPQNNRGVNPQDIPIVDNLVRGMVDSYLAMQMPRTIPPVVAAPTFQSEVENESRAPQDVLGRLSEMYKSKIKKVTHSVFKALSFVYDYDLPRSEGFWSTPEPTLPYKGDKDPIGSFKSLEAPSISRSWTLSSEPQLEEVEEGELPSLEGKIL